MFKIQKTIEVSVVYEVSFPYFDGRSDGFDTQHFETLEEAQQYFNGITRNAKRKNGTVMLSKREVIEVH